MSYRPHSEITSANVQDQVGGIPLVRRLVKLCPWIKTVVVDAGYKQRFIEALQATGHRIVEVVKRPDSAQGFVLLPAATMMFASIGRLLASITMR